MQTPLPLCSEKRTINFIITHFYQIQLLGTLGTPIFHILRDRGAEGMTRNSSQKRGAAGAQLVKKQPMIRGNKRLPQLLQPRPSFPFFNIDNRTATVEHKGGALQSSTGFYFLFNIRSQILHLLLSQLVKLLQAIFLPALML